MSFFVQGTSSRLPFEKRTIVPGNHLLLSSHLAAFLDSSMESEATSMSGHRSTGAGPSATGSPNDGRHPSSVGVEEFIMVGREAR